VLLNGEMQSKVSKLQSFAQAMSRRQRFFVNNRAGRLAEKSIEKAGGRGRFPLRAVCSLGSHG